MPSKGQELGLIPLPKSIRQASETYPKSPAYALQPTFAPSKRFTRALNRLDLVFRDGAGNATTELILRLEPNLSHQEAYRLNIDSGAIELVGSTEMALFRGLTTMGQIHRSSGDTLPALVIEDTPDLPNRGYMLDISRCKVPKLETLFRLIDRLASLKYNQLQLYTEHTFAYRDHEAVWKNASPFTAEDIQTIESFCYDRYIELVPNQNSFGHMDRWLRHESYQSLAECPKGYEHPILGLRPWGGTLKTGQSSIEFISSLYDELLPNFRSDQFNIGGDEPWELGQGASADACRSQGKHRVYLNHLLALSEQVATRGKIIQFWGDIVTEEPELSKELPEDCIGLIWGYEAGHPFEEQCAAFASANRRFYAVPGTTAWNSIGGRLDNASANIEEAARQAIKRQAEGLLLTDWGDFGHHHAAPISWPAIVLASAASWNFHSLNTLDFETAVALSFLSKGSEPLIQSIRELGKLPNLFACQPHNRTLLNDLLFSDSAALIEQSEKTKCSELNRAREKLQEIRTAISRIEPSDEEASIAKAELALTADLLLKAAEKGLRQLGESIPNNLPWEELIERFQSLWLKRNRPGGLDESLSYFRKACE